MTPPFLLYSGRTFIQVHIFTPGLRREIRFSRPGPLIFSAIAEFITVALTAYGTGQSQSHDIVSLFNTNYSFYRREVKS
jgi:hypothetical protein